MPGVKQLTEKVLGACSPVGIPLNTKPAFLLEKIKENYLAEKLLGEIYSTDIFYCKIIPNNRVIVDYCIKALFGLQE